MRLCMALALVGVLGGVAAAQPSSEVPRRGGEELVVKQQRGIFNLVRVNKNLPRQVCGGAEPTNVDVYHTVNDGLAAVFTGILWTPAHLRVTCPPAPSRL